ncbi:MAG: DUF423 domain-containing protein [Flavobacteriaceae bacterium]|nr:DUF423 domain-containing protein [Flavobacteriaceae bacterium]
MNKKILITGAIFAGITVIMGAFVAHGLKNVVSEAAIKTFETGVRYQMYHAFALLILGLIKGMPQRAQQLTFIFFTGGIVLFSGSIYLLALDEIIPFQTSKIGFVTPIGGLLFIAGWAVLIWGLKKTSKTSK